MVDVRNVRSYHSVDKVPYGTMELTVPFEELDGDLYNEIVDVVRPYGTIMNASITIEVDFQGGSNDRV